jgi:uncharacterized pyridoxamine 5'-phosphate oxidase family protein
LNDTHDELKREIWDNFSEQQHIFLATVEEDQPRVRPVTLIHLQDKFFFATGSNDAKVRQIKQNPKTEFCLLLEKNEQKGTIRAQCSAKIVEDKGVKAHVFSKISFLREFWKTPEDPSYTLVKLHPVGIEYMKPGNVQSVKIKL